MGSKVVKPVLLKNVQIEGNFFFFLPRISLSNQHINHVFHLRFFFSRYQESHIRRSVSLARPGHSVESQDPPRVKLVLATHSLAMEPAPAAPVTITPSMQVYRRSTVGDAAALTQHFTFGLIESLDRYNALYFFLFFLSVFISRTSS